MYKIFQIIKNPLNIKQVNTVLSTMNISISVCIFLNLEHNVIFYFNGKVIRVFIIKETNILELLKQIYNVFKNYFNL